MPEIDLLGDQTVSKILQDYVYLFKSECVPSNSNGYENYEVKFSTKHSKDLFYVFMGFFGTIIDQLNKKLVKYFCEYDGNFKEI